MMSGKVQIAFNTISRVLPHVKSGRLKALVITATLLSPLLPSPDDARSGAPGGVGASWHAVVAPAGTARETFPAEPDSGGTIAAPEMRSTLVAQGARPSEATRRTGTSCVKSGEVGPRCPVLRRARRLSAGRVVE